jgi:SAM-dependent methyltransferase
MATTANTTVGRNPRVADGSGRVFAGLSELERSTGVPAADLLSVLEIERSFRARILSEEDDGQRRALYGELYSAVHPLLRGKGQDQTYYERLAKLFGPEIKGKSVLDLGCGDGSLLRAIATCGSPADLTGIDVHDFGQRSDDAFTFSQGDVINFRVSCPVDVVISNQVVEHIAPADLNEHVRSVRNALAKEGTVIVVSPNRLWGPHDITRVCDFTSSNQVSAAGSHLNELTYRDLMTVLQSHGFTNLKTVLPFADRVAAIRRVRLSPRVNLLIEENNILRKLSYFVKWRGRSVYKNPVVLIARRP